MSTETENFKICDHSDTEFLDLKKQIEQLKSENNKLRNENNRMKSRANQEYTKLINQYNEFNKSN